MIPTWMIIELDRMRRERLRQEEAQRPTLELPVCTEREECERERPRPRDPIVIEY